MGGKGLRSGGTHLQPFRLGVIVLAMAAAGAFWLAPAAHGSQFGGLGEPLFLTAGSTPNGPSDVATADFNGDGDPDLAVTNRDDGSVSIFLGGPAGSFSGPTIIPIDGEPESVAVGDFNGDRDPDLAVAAFSNFVSILLGDAGGSFSGPTTVYAGRYPGDLSFNFPYRIEVGDFNADSDPDLAVQRWLTGLVIFLGGEGPTFSDPTEFDTGTVGLASWLVVGDFNGDSDPDIVTRFGPPSSQPDPTIRMLPGGPGGSFGAPTSFDIDAYDSFSAVVGYFDNDKNLDLVTSVGGGLGLLFGNGSGGFAPTVLPSLFRGNIVVGRFDRNSHPDLAISGRTIDRDYGVSVLLGGNTGDFVEATSFFTTLAGAVAAADFNGDKRDDLASVGSFGDVRGNVAIFLQK
jgi:hypothetical protein